MPIGVAIGRELVVGGYIQADETPIPVQTHDKSGKNHQAYLWQYGRPGGSVVFDFQMGRGREGPKKFLGQFKGILQTDGYVAYDKVGGVGMVHACCWAHARRKVFDALKLNPDDRLATQLAWRIDELFAIDAEAREAGMDDAARHLLRQDRARPLSGSGSSSKRWKQRKPQCCQPARWVRRSATRLRSGTTSPCFWNTRKSS